MTITNTPSGGPYAPGPERPFQPTLTPRDAARLGYTKAEVAEAEPYVRMIVTEHQRLGTPRHLWEPEPIHGEHMADPFIMDGEAELTDRLEHETDLLLDEHQQCNETAKANLDELAEKRKPIITPESHTAYSAAEAVEKVAEHDAKVEQAESISRHHHRRAPYWLKKIAPWVPFGELIGFFFFCATWLNVPIFQPWLDFGAWVLAIAIVVSVVLGQTWLIHQAAWNHNHGREAFHEGNRHEGDKAYRRRNWFLIASTLTVTAAITMGMVLRGTNALGGAGLGTTAFMIFIAIVAGVIMPALGYLAIGLDGSKISRERDSLAADLDEDLASDNETIDEIRGALAAGAQHRETLNTKLFPATCDRVQEIVDYGYRPYGLVRLLIGGLTAEPPAKTSPVISREADGMVTGHIRTSIPGAHAVNLKALIDRSARLASLDAERRELLAKVDVLPPHPWGTDRAK